MRESKSSLVLVAVMLVVSLLALASNNSFAFMSPFVTSKRVHFKTLDSFKKKILDAHGGAATISAKGTPSFSSTATTNEGMYATQDDYGTSYYFRGAVNDNWVYFAGFYWRIIRINGDGSVRMIYTGQAAPSASTAIVMTSEITNIAVQERFAASATPAERVGYMLESGNAHGYANDSYIKQEILDPWYTNNLASYASYISDALFCSDRVSYTNTSGTTTGGGTGTTTSYFAPYIRLITNKAPVLTCSTTRYDRFTYSDILKGNGALTKKIGLITADEIAMAGGKVSTSNTSYYLYTNQNYWTMSPSHFQSSHAFVFMLNTSGSLLQNRAVTYDLGVRPVINLKGTVAAMGTGVYNDPYIVENNSSIY